VFERFTARSRRVLPLAQEEARLLGHPYIGTAHILLGLLGVADGVAAQVLASCGLELEGTRAMIRRLEPPGRQPRDAPPFTSEATQVLERSLREALSRGAESIGTEHLLLGLVIAADADDVALLVLAEHGVTAEDVRRRVDRVLGGGSPESQGVVQRYFRHLGARNWTSLGEVLAADVVQVGPLGDEVAGRADYLAHLEARVPDQYGNDVHRVLYAPSGTFAFARVTEHLIYPDRALRLEETYAFEIRPPDLITRVGVFWQSPGTASGS
jgi:hypothetical protein